MKKNKNVSSIDVLIDGKYGKKGTASRKDFEIKAKAFRIGVMVREARKEAKLTQKQVADRSGTKKSYISRLERDASDVRLSTLVRIIEQGLGGKVNIDIQV